MRTINLFLYFISSLFVVICSCNSPDEIIEEPRLEIKELTQNFETKSESRSIEVVTNISGWSAKSSEPLWCAASKSSINNNVLIISVKENRGTASRECAVTVTGDKLERVVTVKQLGNSPALALSPDSLYLPYKSSTRNITVTSNVEKIDIEIQPQEVSWVTCTINSETARIYNVSITENKSPAERTAMVIFKSADPIEQTLARDTLLVTQKPAQGSVSEVDVAKDIKIIPSSGKANQYQPGQNIENTYDGVFGGSPYHSPWLGKTFFPVILEYYFDNKPDIIDYFIYHTRSGNGNFGRLKLYVATQDQQEYRLYGDYDFKETSSPSKITFPDGLKKPTKIKFEVLSGLGGYASCDEMEFFKINTDNPLSGKLLTVFTDISCSALKTGVTDAEINALPLFFGSIATSMKKETYPRDFRIANYQPYSITEEWAEKLIINKRGVLDNCTGIYGEANEEIIVLVGKTNGNQIQLRCIGDGNFNGDNYMLNEGINKIRLRNRGLFYIMYNVSNIQSPMAKPITVHFPMQCGKVNGYWDINIHKTDEKYKELLAAATYPYFDVKGNHMMLKFVTDNGFRKYVPNKIIATVNFWDEMVTWQQSLMGWEGIYPEQMNNRMYARSTPTGYMSAQDYQTNFGEGALYKILNPAVMLQNEDDPWGPAHEIGHMNQGAINWAGNTETSNNLFSNLIHHKMTSFPTRGETMEQNNKALVLEKRVFTNVGTYSGEDIGHASLRMNWQLYCYFHWLENDVQFFPKLFSISRESGRRPIANNPGWSQLNYVRNACDAAKLDLTDFFGFWGFFRPVDIIINQYYEAHLKVTQEMVNETITYVKSKNYPKPKQVIQYIEDRDGANYGDVGKLNKQYKNNTKITKSVSYSKTGNAITISNGDEAVGFEVKEGDELKFFSNKYSFTLPADLWNINCKVYAVQADGVRKLLSP
ncbi:MULTISPECIES: M60 family metallopeptidase [unclassified Proteiniphilum]|uniref:M60 family metallopeptidase n=1 Tax=unclassified Proteiniphilum TaxID=2622718 RepID=UPI002579E3F3|nr:MULTISPECIES: M60 family metallopeptidase [unclassified Proteiniphilum]